MASTFVTLTPSTVAPPSFQAVLDGVNQYVVTVLWNLFGQRYYVQIADLSGNVIRFCPLVGSGPSFQASFTWDNEAATATLASPHNVPTGQLASIWVSQTGTELDGGWQALATDPYTLSFDIQTPLNDSNAVTGAVLLQPINLVQSYITNGWLLYHAESNSFEY